MPPGGNGSPPLVWGHIPYNTKNFTQTLWPSPVTFSIFLGLELQAGQEILVRHRRLADQLNTRSVSRYRAQSRRRQ
jgi:hypothetical protein